MAAYKFHTKPFKHQRDCFLVSRELPAFAYLMEQGTGKTKVGIDTAAYLYLAGLIDALLIAAPNEGDVPDNWIDQVYLHLPTGVGRTAVRAAAASKMRAEAKRDLKLILDKRADDLGLRIISTNIESIRSGSPLFNQLLKFCREFRVLFIIDESTRIKSHTAAQTKASLKLGRNAVYRRIATGTFTPNGPLDAYSQMLFLDPAILGFDSFTAFKAHFCQLLPPQNGLVRWTANKMAGKISDPAKRAAFADQMTSVIQIPARGPDGVILYRNTDELNKKIAPYSFRALKKDCLDLPPKLYVTHYVDMTPRQQLIYDQVKREVIAEFVDKGLLRTVTASLAIVRLLRLQQIACNHFSPDPDPDVDSGRVIERIEPWKYNKKTKEVVTSNPRMQCLLQVIEEAGPVRGIIWCRHHPELREIVEVLSAQFGQERVVQLHGKIKGEERVAARKAFQDLKSKIQWLVGQERSGIGIDLYEASWEFFYSNDYSWENRIQAEDRGHRQGLRHALTIHDVLTRGTNDHRVIASLRNKKDVSEAILGDDLSNWV